MELCELLVGLNKGFLVVQLEVLHVLLDGGLCRLRRLEMHVLLDVHVEGVCEGGLMTQQLGHLLIADLVLLIFLPGLQHLREPLVDLRALVLRQRQPRVGVRRLHHLHTRLHLPHKLSRL